MLVDVPLKNNGLVVDEIAIDESTPGLVGDAPVSLPKDPELGDCCGCPGSCLTSRFDPPAPLLPLISISRSSLRVRSILNPDPHPKPAWPYRLACACNVDGPGPGLADRRAWREGTEASSGMSGSIGDVKSRWSVDYLPCRCCSRLFLGCQGQRRIDGLMNRDVREDGGVSRVEQYISGSLLLHFARRPNSQRRCCRRRRRR
jgi:hypothetical protein